jgi:hypothetical protein
MKSTIRTVFALAVFLEPAGCATFIELGALEKVDCVGSCVDASTPSPPNAGPVNSVSDGPQPIVLTPPTPTPPSPDAGSSMDASGSFDGPPDTGKDPTVDASDASDASATSEDIPFAGPSDSFDDGILEPTLWSPSDARVGRISERNGQLELLPTPGAVSFTHIKSRANYDARNRQIRVEAKEATVEASDSQVYLSLDEQSGYLSMGTYGANMVVVSSKRGVIAYEATHPYNAVTMRWWRFRETNGRTFSEYAAVATGPWMLLADIENPFPMNALTIELGAGSPSQKTSAKLAVFDNLNK